MCAGASRHSGCVHYTPPEPDIYQPITNSDKTEVLGLQLLNDVPLDTISNNVPIRKPISAEDLDMRQVANAKHHLSHSTESTCHNDSTGTRLRGYSSKQGS